MSNDSNLWRISYNDVLLSKNRSNRYYRNRFICNNCSERGHQARDCSLPKKSPTCYLCGLSGHRSEKCKSILCSICMSSSHRSTNCNVSVVQLVCRVCGVKGHDITQCTYNWRKYHLTTTAESEPFLSDLSKNKRISCYNCGAFGKHFGHECRSKALNHWQHVPRQSPLMPVMAVPKKGHSFSERDRNRWHHSVCNGNISSNELDSCSTSFDNTYHEFDLSGNRITNANSYNSLNKHFKWVYPEANSTPTLRNSGRDEVFVENRIFTESTDCSPIFHNEMPSLFNSAHTHTHEELNNSILERSETRPKRSKRKKLRKRNVANHETLNQTNITSNMNKKRKKMYKNIRNRINKRLNKRLAKTLNSDNFLKKVKKENNN